MANTVVFSIQKDSNIRFDFALRLANELQIDVNEICSASPFSGTIKEEEIYPTLPDGLNGALDASRVKTYLKILLGSEQLQKFYVSVDVPFRQEQYA